MKNKALNETKQYLYEKWGEELGEKILKDASNRFEILCKENAGDCKAVKMHTEGDIYPCVCLYEAIQRYGITKQEALKFLDETWSLRAKAGAESMSKILRIAGLYKLYPRMFQMVAKKNFGSAAGFVADFYDEGKKRCKFDMKKCLFLDTCTKLGCPELTQCFCHVDDVNNENLHPRLCWNRTKFMGGGADLCDFDIFVIDDKRKR